MQETCPVGQRLVPFTVGRAFGPKLHQPQEERLGLGIPSALEVEVGQGGERLQELGMLRREGAFVDRQSPFDELPCGGVFS